MKRLGGADAVAASVRSVGAILHLPATGETADTVESASPRRGGGA